MLLGYDIGSSFVKASLIDISTNSTLFTTQSPNTEMPIKVKSPGFAEQNVDEWWRSVVAVTHSIVSYCISSNLSTDQIKSIGISYQMHGLVLLDANGQVLRESIIWCDSRGISYGKRYEEMIGAEFCEEHLLNLPGNFTASKIGWVREHEPEVFSRIYKVMLPGDYIAYRMSGKMQTTCSGLSEMMLWDYTTQSISEEMVSMCGLKLSQLCDKVDTFSVQGTLLLSVSEELKIPQNVKICYRSGDQPNNAFTLNCLHDGEVASTAGTSGVVYCITQHKVKDSTNEVNTFLHVNHSTENEHYGVLLCISGCGCLYSFMKKVIGAEYTRMNELSEQVQIGSDGLLVIPFGNGPERILGNLDMNCSIHGINFFIHDKRHLIRASLESIAFSFAYGIKHIENMGIHINTIKACKANLFLSNVFVETLSGVTNKVVEIYDSDTASGAARGSGIGLGVFTYAECAPKIVERVCIEDEKRRQLFALYYKQWENIVLRQKDELLQKVFNN
ncbi:xylulose kinase, putative [Entamoeba invadens IP1]|uniref:Xylulose kinase, putative n=1 Tax=Entamoeba invadens IP1 TaxID=370355 RepID=A0A0A1UH26_ENTIV|nr:xylulose kinase, putative [Entamoeba invadens IP1]ELP94460.1 xylulose kinase, putative [Entamoeba invadens IP1]|eukprot:XP_004261231.1 xylulose kinase, putative [Entamoeba invadens IP1]